MKTTCLVLLLAPCAMADDSYQTNYDVSRTSKNVKFVYQISAQGSHAPSEAIGLAKNPDDEPKQLNYITPLGIRQ